MITSKDLLILFFFILVIVCVVYLGKKFHIGEFPQPKESDTVTIERIVEDLIRQECKIMVKKGGEEVYFKDCRNDNKEKKQ